MKGFFKKYREIIMYLIFGVLTTIVSWIPRLAITWIVKSAFELQETDVAYFVTYTVAISAGWVAAVVFAFFTNKKFVFENKEQGTAAVKQFWTFTASRVATLMLDLAVSNLFVLLLNGVGFVGFVIENPIKTLNVDSTLISTLVAAVLVVIGNYVLSKILVFKNKDKDDTANTNS